VIKVTKFITVTQTALKKSCHIPTTHWQRQEGQRFSLN